MERSTRAIPLYHIVILCLSQPRNVRRLPGPPVYTFFGRWQTTLVGGPQSTQPSWHTYTCWFRVTSFPFFRFTWKWDFATLPHRHMHTRYKVYVSRLLLRSYDFKWTWWCTCSASNPGSPRISCCGQIGLSLDGRTFQSKEKQKLFSVASSKWSLLRWSIDLFWDWSSGLKLVVDEVILKKQVTSYFLEKNITAIT